MEVQGKTGTYSDIEAVGCIPFWPAGQRGGRQPLRYLPQAAARCHFAHWVAPPIHPPTNHLKCVRVRMRVCRPTCEVSAGSAGSVSR